MTTDEQTARELAEWFAAHFDVGPTCQECVAKALSALKAAQEDATVRERAEITRLREENEKLRNDLEVSRAVARLAALAPCTPEETK